MTTAEELRGLQAPLKERYRADPHTADTPLRAVGAFSEPGITCTVQTYAGPVRAGLHRALALNPGGSRQWPSADRIDRME